MLAVWVAIVLIIAWLSFLTYTFHNESKEINNKISTNQEELIKQISSSQIDLKNLISEFERRHESDIRELQKMLLQAQNHNFNSNITP